MVSNYLKGKDGKYSLTDFGKITIGDAIMAVLFFFAVGVNFSGANVDIPTGAESVVSLGAEATAIAGYSITWALLIAITLFGVQIAQSARNVGRSNSVDIQKYFQDLPTGVTLLIILVAVSHVALFLDITPVMDLLMYNYPAEVGTVAGNTAGYMAVADSN